MVTMEGLRQAARGPDLAHEHLLRTVGPFPRSVREGEDLQGNSRPMMGSNALYTIPMAPRPNSETMLYFRPCSWFC